MRLLSLAAQTGGPLGEGLIEVPEWAPIALAAVIATIGVFTLVASVQRRRGKPEGRG